LIQHLLIEGDKSFVEDFDMEQGIVSAWHTLATPLTAGTRVPCYVEAARVRSSTEQKPCVLKERLTVATSK